MLKSILLAFAFTALVACSGTEAQKNQDRLAAVETGYIVAQKGAILYLELTPCVRNPTPPCRDFNTALTIQQVDRRATAAINAAAGAVKANPSDAAIPGLIAAAQAAVGDLRAAVPAK